MEAGKRKIEEAYRELEARVAVARRLVDDDEKNECFRKYDNVEESFRDH